MTDNPAPRFSPPTPRNPPRQELGALNTALQRAQRTRAETLLAVATGMLTTWDVIDQAARDPLPDLRQLRLSQLLMAAPGWGSERALRILARTIVITGARVPTRPTLKNLRLSWLLDTRTGGNRMAAFCDAMMTRPARHRPPWPGFPFAPMPEEDTRFAPAEGGRI